MFKKGIKHTEEWKENMRQIMKGRIFSEESKRKMSKTNKRLYAEGRINHRKGKHLSEEHKQKLSLSHKGKKFSDEYRKRLSESKKILFAEGKLKLPSRKGIKHTEEWKEKMSQIMKKSYNIPVKKGQSFEDVYGEDKAKYIKNKLKNRIPWNKGLTIEDPRIKKYADNHRGHIGYMLGKHHTEETKEKCRLANLGKHHTEETKEKIRKLNLMGVCGLKGKHHSEETKKKLSEINKKKYVEGKWKIPDNKGEKNGMYGKYGEKNPGWLGGKSFEPYTKEFNKLFKEGIRQRDNFVCLKCNIFEEDAKNLYKKRLHVHHIDYIKENTLKENCCALCLRCNLEVNTNREEWTKFFQALLSKRYGYKYTEDQKIILEF